MILGLDTSHFQGQPNMAAVKSVSREFIVLKATEGTGYVDPTMAANRKAAHAAGLVVGLYHFSRAGNAAAEAAWFLKAVGTLQAGEFLVLDQEVASSVAWCKAWLDAVRTATGVAPLIYMNKGSATGLGMGNWSPVASTYGLWLASYDNAPATQNAVPYWGTPAMKQYSDKGSVLGVAGLCDVNAFYGTRDQLLAYGKQAPTPGVPDMNDAQAAQLAAIFNALNDPQNGIALHALQARDAATGANLLAGDTLTAINTKVIPALGQGADPQAIAAAVVAQLPADQAQAVADLVIAKLGERISTPPAA